VSQHFFNPVVVALQGYILSTAKVLNKLLSAV